MKNRGVRKSRRERERLTKIIRWSVCFEIVFMSRVVGNCRMPIGRGERERRNMRIRKKSFEGMYFRGREGSERKSEKAYKALEAKIVRVEW